MTTLLPDTTIHATPPQDFYETDAAELDGPPGSLIRVARLVAPRGVTAWAILYRSTGLDGSIVPVSGVVLEPIVDRGPGTRSSPSAAASTFGLAGRPIIAWGHGTTGLADACAPSRDGAPALGEPALLDLVRSGFTITATDYEGLGTRGIHPYLVGVSEGRSILDSIRAVAALPESGSDASRNGHGPTDGRSGRGADRAVVVGISQGGHAALWAGELLDSYAPELDVAGVVAASPPIDLRAVQRAVLGSGDVGEVAWLEALMVVAAWRAVYDLPLDGFLTSEAMRIVEALEERCPGSIDPPTRSPFRVDPATVAPWQALLEANSAGRRASRAPLLVLAATQDVLVPPSTIKPGVDRLCAAGSSVALRWIEGGHEATLADPASAAEALAWSIDRLRGLPVAVDCRD